MSASLCLHQHINGESPDVLTFSTTADTVTLVLNSFFPHAGSEALSKSAVSTLVSFVFVHHTLSAEPACVGMVLAHTPPEEALAAVAAGRTVVFPCRSVCADSTEIHAALLRRRHWY